MCDFDCVPVEKYPFGVHVHVGDLLSQFNQAVYDSVADGVEINQIEFDTGVGEPQRGSVGLFIDYKVAAVVFEYFDGFGEGGRLGLDFEGFAFEHFVPGPGGLYSLYQHFIHVVSQIGFVEVALLGFGDLVEVLIFFEHGLILFSLFSVFI